MKICFEAIGFLLLFCSTTLSAQQPRVESLTIADGLSQGMIYDIEQTDDGFMWFATKDGLNRYDGYNFRVFMNDPFNPFSIAGNEIGAIFKDSKGNLWLFILGKGLDVLEKETGRFFHLSSLAGLCMPTPGIAESSDGTIWVGGEKGLFRLRWKRPGYMDTNNPDLNASITVEQVSKGKHLGKECFQSMNKGSDNTLIVFIDEDGLYKFNIADGSLTSLLPVPQSWMCIGKDIGREWTIWNNEVYQIENGSSPRKTWLGSFLHPGVLGEFIFSDGSGKLYFTTKLDVHYGVYSVPEDEIFLESPRSQPILIATVANGRPTALKKDRTGNLWVGTNGYGVLRINLERQPFRHFLQGISCFPLSFDQTVSFLYQDKDYRFDESSNTFQEQKRSAVVPDYTLLIYRRLQAKNGISYCTGYQWEDYFVNFFGIKNASTTEWLRLGIDSDRFCPMLEDAEGNIWLGGGSRLMRFTPATKKLVYFDFYKNLDATVSALHIDKQHKIWVGTEKGIIRLALDGAWQPVDSAEQLERNATLPLAEVYRLPATIYQTDPANPRSLRHNVVTSFCPDPLDPEHYLWVSTKGGGLNLLDKNTGAFRHFTSQNSGLPNDVVYGILPDDQGNLWMSTNRGLSRLTVDGGRQNTPLRNRPPSTVHRPPSTVHRPPSTVHRPPSTVHRSYRFRNFREYDGLQSDEFNTGSFVRGPDGRLYFGGVNGLTAFYPSEIVDRKSDARVLITALKINNLPVDVFQKNSPLSCPIHTTELLRLDYDKNNVSLEFALMDFVTPQENRFRYRLQGADPDWVDVGKSHYANYTRLPPGNYTFEVQGCIAGGEWSVPTALRITILPPWWRTWWAYLSYALALITLILFIRKYELNRIAVREEARHIKELDDAKTRLYTNITHEFRTPLTVIMGMTDKISGHEQERGLIRRNSRKLLQLINQMLDLSKLESGAMKLRLRQADIIPYLRYLTESFHSMAREKEIQLTFYSEVPELAMDFDEEKIQHVVYNLLSNALKFTPKGGTVVLHARQTDHLLQVQVQDTGTGIAPDSLPHIFDRFYQADASHTRKGEGTGIGLALTKEFVELMGGSISATSTPGQGSTFSILLPVKNEAPLATTEMPEQTPGALPLPEPDKATAVTAPVTSGQSHAGDKPLLLIVEDNRDVTTYIHSLVKNDYQVLTAPDGKAGLQTALEHIPDIIISDVMMPEMDGYELTHALKTDERSSHIPIILLTAKAEEQDRIAGLRQGADAYLIKPFNKAELLVRLEKLTELRRHLQARYAGLAVPTPADTASTHPVEDAFLQKLIFIVEARLDAPEFGTPELCKAALLSQPQLHRKLSALTGKSPTMFIRAIRLRKAAELLRTTAMNVSEVAWATGFNDPGYFARVFQEEFGKTPKEWRN